jgi:hypothetical protein
MLPFRISPAASLAALGLPAVMEHAGAASGKIPGLFQVRVAPGDQVPFRVKVGTLASLDGVTVAVL